MDVWCIRYNNEYYISWQIQRDELKVQIAQSYRVTMRKDHQRILTRRQIIEDRKEQLEHLNDQRVSNEEGAMLIGLNRRDTSLV